VGGLAVLTVLVWAATLRRSDGRLHLILPHLPEGEAVFLRTPGGRQILLGSDPHANTLAAVLGREAGIFHRQLDAVVLPFRRASLLDGLPAALERLPCRNLYWAIEPPNGRAAARLNQTIRLAHTPAQRLTSGDRLQLDHDLLLHVVQTDGEKAALLIEYRNVRLLMPNGISPAALRSAAPAVEGATLLLGSLDLHDVPLEAWQSLHPALILLQSGQQGDGEVISTARHGRVEWISDGVAVWLRGERR